MAKLSKLTKFLDRLDSEDVHYTMSSVREGSVLVAVTSPSAWYSTSQRSPGSVTATRTEPSRTLDIV